MMAPWAVQEFQAIDLNDKRLHERAVLIASQWSNLGESTPDIAKSLGVDSSTPSDHKSTADLDALYRFIRNPKVTPKALLEPHLQSSIQRTTQYKRVLLVQDTTDVDLTKPKRQVQGAGPLCSHTRRGFYLHPLAAYCPQGVPLGMVDCHYWTRETLDCESTPEEKKKRRSALPIEEKESYRWLQMVRRGQEIARDNPQTEYVNVSDSESDVGEMLSEVVLGPDNYHLLVRACQNRAVVRNPADTDAPANLQQVLARCPVLYTDTTEVRGRQAKTAVEKRARKQSREDRTAHLEIRIASVELPVQLADSSSGDAPATVTLNVVEALEVAPPEGEPPVHWILLTTLPISNEEEVREIISHYQVRWQIEVFFMTLKSGLHLEDLQYRELSRYLNATMILLVVAWRVQCLTQVGRNSPSTRCDKYFSSVEWKAVFLTFSADRRSPSTAPTMGEFMILVARLGGYINRSQQGPPGVRTIWRGMRRLETLAVAYRAFGPED